MKNMLKIIIALLLGATGSAALPIPTPAKTAAERAPGTAVMERLNRRFHQGGAGILIHQFDYKDGPNPHALWWQHRSRHHGSCHYSASLVNGQMQFHPGRIPIYSDFQAGFVLRADVPVLCAYPRDVGSQKRECNLASKACIPGCVNTRTKMVLWCNGTYKSPCAFRPDDIHTMLNEKASIVQASNTSYWTNEVVIGSADIHKMIEAVFFISRPGHVGHTSPEDDCDKPDHNQDWMTPRCERFARAAHHSLVQYVKVRNISESLPALASFDAEDWAQPFRVVLS